MVARVTRILVALGLVLAAYGAYALAVVPLVEPAAVTGLSGGPSSLAGGVPLDPVARQRSDLAYWFREDEWERRSPKILESPRGKLLLENYRNLGDGRVLLTPCTMVVLPTSPELDDEQRRRQAIILRAPEGAELVFDQPFDLQRAQIGRLIGGKLIGKVTIRSDQKQPGPGDDMQIVCRDLVLVEERVTSPYPVEFRMGAHQGRGRDLEIRLFNDAHPDPAIQSTSPTISGIRWFELKQEVAMRAVMAGQGLLPGTDSPSAPPGTAEERQGPPVEITCQGPFRFDLENYVATFRHSVDVVRLHPTGTTDQLRCELLAIHFTPVGAVAPRTPGQPQKIPRLEPDWLEAQGHPVQVRSPVARAEATCQHLKYQIRTRSVTLEDPQQAIVTRDADELRAPRINFTPAGGNPWGSFFATGPGQMHGWVAERRGPGGAGGAVEEGRRRPVEATWARGVRFAEHEGEHVLTIEGSAHVFAEELGGIDAEVIHAWFDEVPAEPDARTGAARTKLIPKQMMAQKNVQIISSQITARVDALKVWLLHEPGLPAPVPPGVLPPPPEARAVADPPSSGRPLAGPGLPAPAAEPVANQPPAQHFQVEGELLQVELRMRGGRSELSRADVRQRVKVVETQTARPDDQPVVITGDNVEVQQPATGQMLVTILGMPGHVEGRGLDLDGQKIVLDRGANRLRVEQGGKLLLPVRGGMMASLAGPGMGVAALPALPPNAGGSDETLEVRWLGTLDFDGLLARFQQRVVASLPPQTLSTEVLEVRLADRVDFSATAGPPPRLQTLICRQGAMLDRVQYDAEGPLSDERLTVQELVVEHPSGAINAVGPGMVHLVRRGGASTSLALPGGLGKLGPQADPAPAEPPGVSTELTYLGVQFRRGIRGNLVRKELTFFDRVRAVYGPVGHWERRLPLDGDPADWGPRAMRLECDELTLAQLENGSGRPSTEMVASGHADIEGSNFTALAERVTYAEAKQALVLEGSARADALLERQTAPGATPQKAEARKFTYWMDTGNWRIDDFRGGDFTTGGASSR